MATIGHRQGRFAAAPTGTPDRPSLHLLSVPTTCPSSKIGVGTTTGLALGFSSVARGVPLSSTRCRRGAIGERLKRLPMRIAQDEHTAGALIESGLLLGIACPVCRHRALFDLQRIAPHPRPVWQLPF